MKKYLFYLVLILTMANCTKENVDNEVKNLLRGVFIEFISKLERIVSGLSENDLTAISHPPIFGQELA